MIFEPDDIVLFQGDSITASGRDRTQAEPNNADALGRGYALQIAATGLLEFPCKHLRFLNRGVGGNRLRDLVDRWENDCLQLNPALLSVLIGINDVSSFIGSLNADRQFVKFEEMYRRLLRETKSALPRVRLVLCEPFVLEFGQVRKEWIPVCGRLQNTAKQLAAEFGSAFVPFQAAFDQALTRAPAEYWTYDGVHPSVAGHQLMARCWLQSVKDHLLDRT